jgi:spore germination protein GerM
MRRPLAFALALVVASTGVAACGLAADEGPSFVAEEEVPFDLLDPAPPGTAASPEVNGTIPTTVCLTGADGRIHPSQRVLPPGSSLDDLVGLLAAGPTDDERRYGLSTTLAEPGSVVAVVAEGGVATVDLDPSVGSLPGTDQLEAVAQLVCTLTAQPGIGQVVFRVDGRPISVPRGDGSTTAEPVARRDYEAVIVADG